MQQLGDHVVGRSEKKKGVKLRTGLFHVKMIDNDVGYLFKILNEVYKKPILGAHPNFENYNFRLAFIEETEDYFSASISRINKETTTEQSHPDDSEDPVTFSIKNKVSAAAWFYLDKEYNIILEENSYMERRDVVRIIDDMIQTYLENYDPEHSPFLGRGHFEVTFDRLQDKGFVDFFTSIKKLTTIEFEIMTETNPFEDKAVEKMEKAIMDAKLEKAKLEGDALNKQSDLVQSVMSLTSDGHLDTILHGLNEENKLISYACNEKNEDVYPVGSIEKKTSAFVEKAKTVLNKVKELREKNQQDRRSPK